jgi:transcriptional regulator with XRE-family HTH domain
MTNPTGTPGEAIRTMRVLAGLTLQQAADIGDTSATYLSKVERGQFVPTKAYVARVIGTLAAYIQTAHVTSLTEKVPA